MPVWVIFDGDSNKPIDVCYGNIIAYMDMFYNVTAMKSRFFDDVASSAFVELVFSSIDFDDADKPFLYYVIPVIGKYPR